MSDDTTTPETPPKRKRGRPRKKRVPEPFPQVPPSAPAGPATVPDWAPPMPPRSAQFGDCTAEYVAWLAHVRGEESLLPRQVRVVSESEAAKAALAGYRQRFPRPLNQDTETP